MKSNAPGQLLGFGIQFPRALCHLLNSGPGDCICIEVLGDVAKLSQDGTIISEEDKSSVVGNPLTDKSSDLWKTFSNWIDAIKSGHIELDKARFILYSNNKGKLGIVNRLSSASSLLEAKAAIVEAENIFSTLKTDHPAYQYINNVLKHPNLFEGIILRFDLEIGTKAGFDDVLLQIRAKHVPDSQVQFLCEKLAGWLLRNVLEKIALKIPAVISWIDFDHEFQVIFDRTRRRELLDFASHLYDDATSINEQVQNNPLYIRQIEAVDCTDEEIIDAVTDYLRAKVNLSKWIESEIIDDAVASDFENKLIKFWENKKKLVLLTQKLLPEKEQGLMLYTECKCRQEKIRDMSPPSSTIEGTYHSLANQRLLGWHPQWGTLFPVAGEV